MTIFSVRCIRSIEPINSLTEVEESSQAPVIIPGANRVIMDVIAKTTKDSRLLNVVSAMRSSAKQARYKSRYLPAVLKRRSDRISTKGIRLNTGFTKFIIPSLLVLNINVVTVNSKINFVRGSSRIPFLLSVVAEKDTPSIIQAVRPKWQRQKSRQPQG